MTPEELDDFAKFMAENPDAVVMVSPDVYEALRAMCENRESEPRPENRMSEKRVLRLNVLAAGSVVAMTPRTLWDLGVDIGAGDFTVRQRATMEMLKTCGALRWRTVI